ncbi:MAG: HD domain-containing protein [Pseudomonadota bacterium]
MSAITNLKIDTNVTVPVWPAKDAKAFVDDLIHFMVTAGVTHYDGEVTQLEHALQTAFLADRAQDSDHAVAAALLHDVGHLLQNEHTGSHNFLETDCQHEVIGAQWLSMMFPSTVTDPIADHVMAKRYLCSIRSDYWNRLSESSQRSFELQGGGLSLDRQKQFEALPHFSDTITLRWRDESAKKANRSVPQIENYRSLLESLVVR